MGDRGDHCHCVVYGIDFSWFAAGLSALLTWLMNVPGPRRDRFTGIVIYIAAQPFSAACTRCAGRIGRGSLAW